MKKFYSLVLMAAALLIGTNAWAGQTRTAANDAQLQAAWAAAQNGDVIQLTNDVTLTKTLWLGTNAMNDASKSITLDLNGHLLTASNPTVKKLFFISHGELIVKSEVAGGQISHTGPVAQEEKSVNEIFRLTGSTYKNVDPKTAESGYYSHLVIMEGVKLTALANAIVIDRVDGFSSATSPVATAGINNAAISYDTNVYNKDRGVANGVRVDVYGTVHANKYGIKANGNMGSPATSATEGKAAYYWANPEQTIQYVIAGSDVNYAPFIYVHSSAEIKTLKPSSTAAIATYSGGYSRWLIEGYCEGSTGVYVKSGEVTLDDAVVKSNYQGTYVPAAHDQKSGVDAGGSGVVVESATAYAGNIDVNVQGDTRVTGTTGYAIDEAVTAVAGVTKVDGITITGGTFETGAEGKGSIKISEPTAAANAEEGSITEITIAGGQMQDIQLGDPEHPHDLDEVIKPEAGETAVHVTYVDNGKGGQTMVVSQGEAPSDVTAMDQAADSASVQLTATEDEIPVGDTVVLAELVMSENYNQTLTIKDQALLKVGRIILGAKAQIIVEAGAKLIVNGEQGIVAPVVSNIVLKSEGALLAADRKHATFLFNPAVSSNRHPNATVELTTYSYVNSGSDYQWERFGVPTWNALKSISGLNGVSTRFTVYEGTSWKELGYLDNTEKPAAKAEDFKKPFATFNLLAYRGYDKEAPAVGPKYQFAGELMGNEDANLNVTNYWTPFTNSYSASMSVAALLTEIEKAQIVDHYIYIGTSQGKGKYAWNALDIDENDASTAILAPMQAFILKKVYGSTQTEEVALNYNKMVYAPATAKLAPRRRVASNDFSARVRIEVSNEEGVLDNVKLRETVNRTKEAEKYMNDDVNIYAMGGDKAAILATDDLENTYVGFSTIEGGKFTISFANVEGRELVLVDHETGARVAMVEDATYEFTAAANSVNDYRFEIVEPAKLPTAIENTEAVKSAKGIYTITGQFVGEMNVWNTLPAGIYVVNGEKRVK